MRGALCVGETRSNGCVHCGDVVGDLADSEGREF